MWMRQSGEFPRVEIAFRVQRDIPMLIRSTSTSGDYANSSQTKDEEDKNIEEGLTLLMNREPKGNKILVCWTCK